MRLLQYKNHICSTNNNRINENFNYNFACVDAWWWHYFFVCQRAYGTYVSAYYVIRGDISLKNIKKIDFNIKTLLYHFSNLRIQSSTVSYINIKSLGVGRVITNRTRQTDRSERDHCMRRDAHIERRPVDRRTLNPAGTQGLF